MDGHIRSLNRLVTGSNGVTKCIKGRELINHILPNGYSYVFLSKNGNRIRKYVHRLVALTFIPNPESLPQINHKDEDPQNNSVNNLEWCTQKYNSNYGTSRRRISEKNKNHDVLSNKVAQYTLHGDLIAEYPSMKEAQRVTGVLSQNIYSCCVGKYTHAGGFRWQYVSCAEKNNKVRKKKATLKRFKKLGKSTPLFVWKDGESNYTLYRSFEAASRGTGVPVVSIKRYALRDFGFHKRGYKWEAVSNENKLRLERAGFFDMFGEAVPQTSIEKFYQTHSYGH